MASRRTEGDVALLSPEILVRDLQDRIEHNTISRATARLERAASLFWLAERAQDLLDAGYISKTALVKILGNGKLTSKIEVEANAFSKSAEEAIVAAGGAAVKI